MGEPGKTFTRALNNKSSPKRTEIPHTGSGFSSRRAPLAETDKRPKVLILEPEPNLLTLVEKYLRDGCNLQFGYRNFDSVKSILRFMAQELDAVVIGVSYRKDPQELARAIRTRYPSIQIIKLATSSEKKRMDSCKETSGDFDLVIDFNDVDKLSCRIVQERDIHEK